MPCDEEDHVGMEVWQPMGDQIRSLREALSLARSMILCGEKMSPRAQAQIDAALQLFDGTNS